MVTPADDVTELLNSYARFGVDLGLDRIEALLAALNMPQQRVPIVHVAGTNGKGSVCAYLSAVLTAAGYRVGRYTSPHLVRWVERICLNDRPIDAEVLRSHLQQVHTVAQSLDPIPTQFEVLTAAAFCYFAAQSVDIAVLEVGLGGRLDATNVCPTPLVSVIVSIGRDHWQRLGPTLADIAGEKAGILKAARPAVIGPLPPDADAVVRAKTEALGCPTTWVTPATAMGAELTYGAVRYPQVLLGDHQRINSAVAIATLQSLQTQGWQIPASAISQGMAQVRWPGRLQWVTWHGHPLLIDGAHNAAAALALRAFVEGYLSKQSQVPPTRWLMGMLATKDHQAIFEALLRPGDALHLVPVPDHASAEPADLANLAQRVCPQLAAVTVHSSLADGLAQVAPAPGLSVLCGSLYLLGHFLETLDV
ncbi:MAG: folylpolyglutamate synthase/dihydrofolate synthase family protein [Cyanobacteria bacterium P01_A01_bin.105]